MKIGVVGVGFVGSAMVRTLQRAHEVVTYDPKDNGNDRSSLQSCRAFVICVPTPRGEGGRCDTSLVEETVEALDPHIPILIKSTIEPGTTYRLTDQPESLLPNRSICFSPEFIGSEPTWPALNGDPDPKDPDRHGWCVIGGYDSSFWVDVLMPCLGPGTRFYQCSALEAELVKYMENTWLATKVTFCNEWAQIARTFGVDYNRLRELWLADPRVGRSHTAVFKDNPGWGGRCFPKDMDAIIKACHDHRYSPWLLEQVRQLNNVHRNKK